jgi:branched-chain amino acid transport system permease protein
LITLVGIYALVTIGLNLFMGYAGQVSLGQAGFVGVGAYTAAVLSVKLQWSPWLGLLAGGVAAAIVAFGLSFVVLRLRENLLALATLALGIVLNVVFNQWEFLGGSSGVSNIPSFAIGGFTFDLRAHAILSWLLVALGLAFAGYLVRSNFGRALIAISAGELGAASIGIDAQRLKRQTFVLSAVYAGLAGGVYASYQTYIDPTSFGFLLSVNFVLMSVIVVALTQVLQAVVPLVIPSARGDFQSCFLGVILIAMLVFLPQGLVSRFRQARA